MQFKNMKLALLQKPQESKRILPFVTQYHPAMTNLKQILMKDWHLKKRQPLAQRNLKNPLLVYTKGGRSVKYILVRESGEIISWTTLQGITNSHLLFEIFFIRER